MVNNKCACECECECVVNENENECVCKITYESTKLAISPFHNNEFETTEIKIYYLFTVEFKNYRSNFHTKLIIRFSHFIKPSPLKYFVKLCYYL